jgi:hemerythrin-like domain-containing protein
MDPPADPDGRVAAFGNQLIEAHIWLREELARLRADIGSGIDGHAGRPRELRAHCLTFCSALSRHHLSEDDEAFPLLADQFPELRPVLVQLASDHQVVASILHRIEELLGGLGPGPSEARRVRAELDGLAALLESHFVYEEKRLAAALNSLTVPDWNSPGPDFLRAAATRPDLSTTATSHHSAAGEFAADADQS